MYKAKQVSRFTILKDFLSRPTKLDGLIACPTSQILPCTSLAWANQDKNKQTNKPHDLFEIIRRLKFNP